jgi:hypothetical protein
VAETTVKRGNTLDFYSKGDGIPTSARTQAILNEVIVVFLNKSRCNAKIIPPLGHNGFLPNTFQFITYLSLHHSTLYSQRYRNGLETERKGNTKVDSRGQLREGSQSGSVII